MTSVYPFGIVGWTGLVGQTLFHQLLSTGIHPSDIALYNSKNLKEIRGAEFNVLYISCMPAEKWRANQYPENDRDILKEIIQSLQHVRASKVLLMSTVDVLQSDCKEGEESEAWSTHAYGRHRREFEQWVLAQWPTSTIVRLPALFGRGLKKNALHDLLHAKNLSTLCLDSEFQWYNLARLLRDCNDCMKFNFPITHLVTPPISMRDIVDTWFPELATECIGSQKIQYDLHTSQGGTLDGPYCCQRKKVMKEMGAWIAWERWRMSQPIAASNIGFTMTEDVAKVLHHLGINCLEIAPARGMEWANFPLVSVQSLLYTLPITNIFMKPNVLQCHIKKLMISAANKGITRFVFGCPKQRDLGTTSLLDAIDLFRKLGDLGTEYGITLCLEPNARAYGCTWLTNIADTQHFIKEVNHPNIRLSLDSGNYWMEQDISSITDVDLEWIGHCQISASHLLSHMNLGEYVTALHIVENLWSRGYKGAISYEAREPNEGFSAYCKGLGQFMNLLEAAHKRIIDSKN